MKSGWKEAIKNIIIWSDSSNWHLLLMICGFMFSVFILLSIIEFLKFIIEGVTSKKDLDEGKIRDKKIKKILCFIN